MKILLAVVTGLVLTGCAPAPAPAPASAPADRLGSLEATVDAISRQVDSDG